MKEKSLEKNPSLPFFSTSEMTRVWYDVYDRFGWELHHKRIRLAKELDSLDQSIGVNTNNLNRLRKDLLFYGEQQGTDAKSD